MAEPIRVGVEIRENLSAAFDRAIAFGDDLTPAMKDIAIYLERVHKLRFQTETGPGGVPWKPNERGGRILFLSGDLESSVHADYGPTYAEVGPERSFGAAIYAAIHQFGGIIRAKVKKALRFGARILAQVYIPARPYVGFDAADQDAIAEILGDHLRRALGGGEVTA